MSIETLMKKALETKQDKFGDKIEFAFPNQTLALTTTGNECGLSCAHCNGHYLKNMTNIEDYDSKNRNISSFLLSGGCSTDGDVPLIKHLETIKKFKEEGYKLNSHLGLVGETDIEEVCKYIDMVSFDLVFDEETIKEVYKINKTKDDYIKTYEEIKKYTEVAPHICIGLKGGEVKGEYEIIDYLTNEPPEIVTFIVLIPTKGTEYENVDPPNLDDVAKVLCDARIKLPNTKINLGCMRPRGRYRGDLDLLAIKCGVNKIVLPSKRAKNYAVEHNLEIIESKECCVL